MKILIIGSNHEGALENYYVSALQKLDTKVHLFPAQDIYFKRLHSSVFYKYLNRIVPSFLLISINRQLLHEVIINSYDIIWVFKGMEIFPETIAKMKKKAKVVNYNPDHPFKFFSRGSGNSNVKKSLKLFDLYLTYSHKIEKELQDNYGLNTNYLPFGYSLSDQQYEECKSIEEIKAICFIGNPDGHRAKVINYLLDNSLPVVVFGNGWDKYFTSSVNPNLSIHPAIFGTEFWKNMRKYRIQLNIFRPHNEQSHNMRTFEIPAVGGIMLAPQSEEHLQFFREDVEAFYYTDNQDMLEKAKKILALSSQEADMIRRNARNSSIKNGYSYENRTKEVIHLFESLV